MIKLSAIILAALLVLSLAAQVQAGPPELSGGAILPACKEYLKDEPVMGAAEIYCSAVIMAIMAAGNTDGAYLLCPPSGSTPDQAIRVVVIALESYPAIVHEDFIRLAIYILRKTWPCQVPTGEFYL